MSVARFSLHFVMRQIRTLTSMAVAVSTSFPVKSSKYPVKLLVIRGMNALSKLNMLYTLIHAKAFMELPGELGRKAGRKVIVGFGPGFAIG